MLTLYGYLNCGTCRNAIAWLDDHGIAHKFIDITKLPPSKATLKKLLATGDYEIKHLYNTSGLRYRELGITEKRKTMSEAQQLDLLAGNGMLIRRPIVTDGKRFTVGFKPEVFDAVWHRGS